MPGQKLAVLEVLVVHMALPLLVLLGKHPPNVRVPKALDNGVRVLVRVNVLVVRSVAPCPPLDAALYCCRAHEDKD